MGRTPLPGPDGGYPRGGRPWDWKETGTRHVPGILPVDVQELLDKGSEVVILSRGMELRREISPETIRFLKERKVEYHLKEAKAAVELYNQLASKETAVGGLFHSTR